MTGEDEISDDAALGAPTPADGDITRYLAEHGVDLTVHGAVFHTIRAAALLVNALEEFALRPLGLSHAGYRILVELAAVGPREPRQLAAFMLVSRPAIVRSIDTLSRRGYVQRVRSTTDRRLVTVQVTPAGTEIVERAVLAWHEGQRRASSVLTRDEMEMLGRLNGTLGDQALQMRGEYAGEASTD